MIDGIPHKEGKYYIKKPGDKPDCHLVNKSNLGRWRKSVDMIIKTSNIFVMNSVVIMADKEGHKTEHDGHKKEDHGLDCQDVE